MYIPTLLICPEHSNKNTGNEEMFGFPDNETKNLVNRLLIHDLNLFKINK